MEEEVTLAGATLFAGELAGEALWLLAVACNELGVNLESAADAHLRVLAELAKKHSSDSP